jgi:hypothetical protein
VHVLFDYMYRDYDNWKMPGSVVFVNPDGLPLDVAATRLRRACCEDGNFNARQVDVPEVYYENTNVETEQIFHEFCGLEPTSKPTSDPRTLLQFLGEFEAASRSGWISQPALNSLGYPLPVGRKTLDGRSIGLAPKADRCTLASPQRTRKAPLVKTSKSKVGSKRRARRRLS